jgi:nucleotide sugar dehydrogenase
MNPHTRGTVTIIGQGYVGLPLAMAAFRSGWKVFGIDSSPQRVDQLKSGISPIEDISSFELQSALNSGRYVPTGSFTEVSNSQIIIFCVPTPLDKDQKPDLSALLEASEMSAPLVQEGCLVISESTSFPGTLREFIIPIFFCGKLESPLSLKE